MGMISRCPPHEMSGLVLAYAGLRQMGCDWSVIKTGLNVDKERGYKSADIDRLVNVYNLLEYGVPVGLRGDLRRPIICPRCRQMLSAAPCQRCVMEGAWPSSLEDVSPDLTIF